MGKRMSRNLVDKQARWATDTDISSVVLQRRSQEVCIYFETLASSLTSSSGRGPEPRSSRFPDVVKWRHTNQP
jgi:hypothetical protein